jgi:MFS family permease
MTKRFSWLSVRDRGAFVRLTGVLFLVYLATGLWAPLLAVYTRSLGADTAQIGLVLATFQATNLASQYWWGPALRSAGAPSTAVAARHGRAERGLPGHCQRRPLRVAVRRPRARRGGPGSL